MSEPTPRRWTETLASRPLLWPVLALVALLVVNLVANHSLLDVRMQDGHLYGNLIDISQPTISKRPPTVDASDSLKQGHFFKDGADEGPIP